MYRFIEDEATADIAFEATGKTLEDVLESSALATTNVMVRDLRKVSHIERVAFSVKGDSDEMLLFNFLQEIIFYKDAKQLLFSKYSIKLGKSSLECVALGEKIDQKRHDLVVDVKAVTLHLFELKRTKGSWKAHVILDI
ncbi:MAG: archease [Candidatus Aenigmarchaeota archaeon]|nr:archease [Candidatus Aenigmarchaeota archaeon]